MMELTMKHYKQVKSAADTVQTYIPYVEPTLEELVNVIMDYIDGGNFNSDRLYGRIRRFMGKYFPYGFKPDTKKVDMDKDYADEMFTASTEWIENMPDSVKEVIFMRVVRLCKNIQYMMPYNGDNLRVLVENMYGEIRDIAKMI